MVARFDSVEALQKAASIPHLCFFHDPAARRVLPVSNKKRVHQAGSLKGIFTERVEERERDASTSTRPCWVTPTILLQVRDMKLCRICQAEAFQIHEPGKWGDVGIRNEGVSWRWATLGLKILFLEARDP
ncbi:hypothetical protein CH63R_05314 [Colletotrichum higginsianum IMI 349063]|nr:hypothetical protein CH63R_05314 [Colletotrichum higginsianum IMI 349063]OBR13018.1 hypothetical protein CH63R_05314 [Colletotrichum higginsianum IMI 349063]